MENPKVWQSSAVTKATALTLHPPVRSGASSAVQDRAPCKQAPRGQKEPTEQTSVMMPSSHWMSAIRVILKPWGWAQQQPRHLQASGGGVYKIGNEELELEREL